MNRNHTFHAALRVGRQLTPGLLLLAIVTMPALAQSQVRDLFADLGVLKDVRHPEDNPSTPAKVALGKRLFFDPRLSGDGKQSCATCHIPALGWADGRALGVGFQGKTLARNTPTVLNSAHYSTMFWDGRAGSLEEQALGPLFNPDEMNTTPEQLAATLANAKDYQQPFQEVFGTSPSVDGAAKALATFQRSLSSSNSPFDRWVRGENDAMTPQAKRGLKLFMGKADCTACHKGPTLSDDKFHNIGVPGSGSKDLGRYAVTKDPEDWGAFRTPGLRNVALTAPYMHDGSQKTLRETVKHYEDFDPNFTNLDPLVEKHHLTEAEIDDIVAFLEALTDPNAKVVP
jgi:cytochrome c peroxidase